MGHITSLQTSILSRASEAGSLKNRLGSNHGGCLTKRLRHAQELCTALTKRIQTDKLLKIKKIRANIRPVLLRQGEPGMPQYVQGVA